MIFRIIYTLHSNLFISMCVERVSWCYVDDLFPSRASQSIPSSDLSNVTWVVHLVLVLDILPFVWPLQCLNKPRACFSSWCYVDSLNSRASQSVSVRLTSSVVHPPLGFVSCPFGLHFSLGVLGGAVAGCPSVSCRGRVCSASPAVPRYPVCRWFLVVLQLIKWVVLMLKTSGNQNMSVDTVTSWLNVGVNIIIQFVSKVNVMLKYFLD